MEQEVQVPVPRTQEEVAHVPISYSMHACMHAYTHASRIRKGTGCAGARTSGMRPLTSQRSCGKDGDMEELAAAHSKLTVLSLATGTLYFMLIAIRLILTLCMSIHTYLVCNAARGVAHALSKPSPLNPFFANFPA